MNTPQPLQLTDRERREAAWNCCFDCGEAYDKNHEELEDARTNARLDAQAEREDQIQHERGDDEP